MQQTIRWELCNSRRLGVQGALAWNGGIGKYFQQRYGTGIFNTLTYFDGKRTDYFFDQEQHASFNAAIDANFSNREFVLSMISEAKEVLEEKYGHLVSQLRNYQHLSWDELQVLYQKVSHLHSDFYPRKWMAYRICHRIDLQIGQKLQELGKSEQEIGRFLQRVSVPLQPNYVLLEKMDLLKIAHLKNTFSPDDLQKALQEHTAKYQHIPLFDIDHEPFSIEHFTKELFAIQNPEQQLKAIEGSFSRHQEDFASILQDFFDRPDIQDFLIMLKKAVFFRDYADTIRQKLNLHLQKFYTYLAQKMGVKLDDIVLLTNREIESCLIEGKTFNSRELAKRKEAFLLQQIGNKISLISGEAARQEACRLRLHPKIMATNLLHGTPASPGSAQGKVKVIYTNKDLFKIKEGDIMVTTMTRQDFVPYLRKIKALVTEEGGMSCHAAIIARELGVPCIVGVSQATRFFQDGECVEVDATEGKVKRLSPSPPTKII